MIHVGHLRSLLPGPKELQKTQVEEDAKAVRAENQSLREQLANEQRVSSKGSAVRLWAFQESYLLENKALGLLWFSGVKSFKLNRSG